MTTLAAVSQSQPAAQRLRAALESGRLAHAYLITGATAPERRAFADAFARAVLCTGGGADACGSCRSCQLALSGNHPDLGYWSADGTTFKLAHAQDLQAQAWVRPLAAPRKVFVLEDAGAMTAEAANALLKLLEEPPGDALFLLLAPSARTLLPTIISRAQPLVLRGDAVNETPAAAEAVWDLLSRLPHIDDVGIGQIAEAWERDKGLAKEQLHMLFALWRDTIALAVGCPPALLYKPDWAPRLQSILPHWNRSELVAGLAAIGRAQRQLEQNANLRLCLEVLFTSLMPAM